MVGLEKEKLLRKGAGNEGSKDFAAPHQERIRLSIDPKGYWSFMDEDLSLVYIGYCKGTSR